MVRISFWSWPLSPTALRAALMRLVSVASETIRPPQTDAMRSSLVTTRSRFSHQVDQQIEHLRLDRNRLGAAAQLAPVGIKRMIGKENCTLLSPGLPGTLHVSISKSAKSGRLSSFATRRCARAR